MRHTLEPHFRHKFQPLPQPRSLPKLMSKITVSGVFLCLPYPLLGVLIPRKRGSQTWAMSGSLSHDVTLHHLSGHSGCDGGSLRFHWEPGSGSAAPTAVPPAEPLPAPPCQALSGTCKHGPVQFLSLSTGKGPLTLCGSRHRVGAG